MGIFSDLFTRMQDRGERRGLSLTNYQQWVDLGLVSPVASGVTVTEGKALTYSTIYACTRILAETVASMPLIVYERLERGKRRAPDHYLYSLLHDAPNEKMTSFEFRETLQGHLALWGNAYAHIEYDGRGRVVALFPLRPDRLLQTGTTEDGRTWYEFQIGDMGREWFPEDRIWHLRGLSNDGQFGYSPIRLLKQGIGLGLAAEEFGARFFGSGASLGGILRHPGVLGDEAMKRLRDSWNNRQGGLSNAHKTAILEEGMDYQSIGIPPEDAQFLETRMFQVRDVARAYRVPLHMLADLERASFSNIEQQSIEFATYTMLPWFVRWEKSIQQNLMLPQDRPTYFAEFLADALQRGDIETRWGAYNQAWMIGAMSQNEIRERENLNPIEGGDEYYVPLNMGPAGDLPTGGDGEPRHMVNGEWLTVNAEEEREARAARHVARRLQLRKVYRPLITEAAGRVFRREANDVANAWRKFMKADDLAGFVSWLAEFYQEHEEFSARQMEPVMQAYGALVAPEAAGELDAEPDPEEVERFVGRYTRAWSARAATRSQNEIDTALQAQELDELDAALDMVWSRWREERPETVGREEGVRAGEAISGFVWLMAGATAIRWRTAGDTCPYCRALDGRVVGMQSAFIPAGSDYQPDGADVPLRPHSNIRHAPAHKGCDCYTTAGG